MKLLWRFGGDYILPLVLFNGIMGWLITLFGLSVLAPLWFPHAVLFGLLYGWSVKFRKDQYYYYYNLGLGKRHLWTWVAALDIVSGLISIGAGYFIYAQS